MELEVGETPARRHVERRFDPHTFISTPHGRSIAPRARTPKSFFTIMSSSLATMQTALAPNRVSSSSSARRVGRKAVVTRVSADADASSAPSSSATPAKKVVVLGGSGFVGQRVVQRLAAAGAGSRTSTRAVHQPELAACFQSRLSPPTSEPWCKPPRAHLCETSSNLKKPLLVDK